MSDICTLCCEAIGDDPHIVKEWASIFESEHYHTRCYWQAHGLILQLAAPQPDWSLAPDWANWWAVDPNGWAHWFQEEPVLALTINYSGWLPKTVNGIQIGMELWAAELDLALGVDWRLTKHQRTTVAAAKRTSGDDAAGETHPIAPTSIP